MGKKVMICLLLLAAEALLLVSCAIWPAWVYAFFQFLACGISAYVAVKVRRDESLRGYKVPMIIIATLLSPLIPAYRITTEHNDLGGLILLLFWSWICIACAVFFLFVTYKVHAARIKSSNDPATVTANGASVFKRDQAQHVVVDAFTVLQVIAVGATVLFIVGSIGTARVSTFLNDAREKKNMPIELARDARRFEDMAKYHLRAFNVAAARYRASQAPSKYPIAVANLKGSFTHYDGPGRGEWTKFSNAYYIYSYKFIYSAAADTYSLLAVPDRQSVPAYAYCIDQTGVISEAIFDNGKTALIGDAAG